ncbi:GSCFA domain-containing protein [Agrobacterium sp. SHOUNA12C]|uniref:GSCFA domain-containing protein n=1 Tax=Rhizobium rhizogenes TaxID=359 RepID=UPI00055BF4D7|nr:GSCFA domain-containing protein [Rhizobium rhizogenes]MCJ9723947.1 GSCFA domain-containing protein [Agrobacterium sp. BETTINA12B]MCJ9759147.1 GSCFA domain-containing protein [Agrobacterium sp. SHOUNA12C]OCJ21690.1 GSCFA family protein [Agrobacterium sp. B131/95]OCJ26863.1 GSCFA family protein [Agrobacterium sp. B133/95]MDJ1633247.1 GSCFA domain-containing protein [Rhizobium rhizogenes]
MSNPYSTINDYQLWRRSVARVETHMFDPIVNPRFKIDRQVKVATAGSCFAQHISRQIQRIGFHYFIAEKGEHLSDAERSKRNFGVFSARYGNIYTARQLLQLFDEVFEGREPAEKAWLRKDGRFVDPYRPQIEPDGYESPEAVIEARHSHLAAVRSVFLDSDVLVFTLGLTESWRSKADGSVFPLAPGVTAGLFDPNRYEFVNFTVEEVDRHLSLFLKKLKEVNPRVKVLLTVSPVPLVATYENRNVLVSTTYSKAVLRVVAEQMLSRFDWIDYFPSYEIITGSYAGGLYYEDDYREVNHLGVAHVMRCFVRNYVSQPSKEAEPKAVMLPPPPETEYQTVVCDEREIEMLRP